MVAGLGVEEDGKNRESNEICGSDRLSNRRKTKVEQNNGVLRQNSQGGVIKRENKWK